MKNKKTDKDGDSNDQINYCSSSSSDDDRIAELCDVWAPPTSSSFIEECQPLSEETDIISERVVSSRVAVCQQ